MSSIYIHIPFCKQKCHYCNFFTVISQRNKSELVAAIINEIILKKDYLDGALINTIYFGGGTPSLLDNIDFENIFNALYSNFSINKYAEITVEANPDDLSLEKIIFFKSIGINRLSVGIQSFNDVILKKLNRVHTAKEAFDSITMAHKIGLDNINIDLIYGIPSLDLKQWEKDLKYFIELDIPHLSAYSLTVEEKTTLHYLIKKKKYPIPKDEDSIEHFNFLLEFLDKYNIEQYEISNFAKDGRYSKHNTNYWLHNSYLGLGPSAHSYNIISRQWNAYSVSKYISDISKGVLFHEEDILSVINNYNEYVMLSLRTKWGVSLKFIKDNFGSKIYNHFLNEIYKPNIHSFTSLKNGVLTLNKIGKNYADRVASDLFL